MKKQSKISQARRDMEAVRPNLAKRGRTASDLAIRHLKAAVEKLKAADLDGADVKDLAKDCLTLALNADRRTYHRHGISQAIYDAIGDLAYPPKRKVAN